MRSAIHVTTLLLLVAPAGRATASSADLTADGVVDAADVQCAVVAVVAAMSGGELPSSCQDADVDCSGSLSVVDAQVVAAAALGEGLPASVDADADGIFDACQPAAATVVLRGARLAVSGEAVDVAFDGDTILDVTSAESAVEYDAAAELDVSDLWISPAFIDSHVHLAFLPVADELAASGVGAAVDHAAPVSVFSVVKTPLTLVNAGPMITANEGYPTTSWGAGGYGLEVGSTDEAVAAVDTLAALGAGLIKVPLAFGPQLSKTTLAAVVDRAHEYGLPVSAHALTDAEAAIAYAVGADVLAHTPTSPLSAESVLEWSTRAVITTLAAFGSDFAVDNLQMLREAGATVLYGTDLGNTSDPSIQAAELLKMVQSGMTGEEILASGTTSASAFWGLDDFGVVEVGFRASVILTESNPGLDPLVLAAPELVFVEGALTTP